MARSFLHMLIFPTTEICAELCCQSTWGHLPQLYAKFEPWITMKLKHLSFLDMKQMYILKLIPLRSITLSSTGIISRIPCFIDDLLYVAYLSSYFSNSKMVTKCQLKPISMNFDSPQRGRGMHLCVEDMVQNWIGQKKMTILVTISYLFCCNKDLIRAILPIYYGTSSRTFCQILGLIMKEAFEKNTALKFEF